VVCAAAAILTLHRETFTTPLGVIFINTLFLAHYMKEENNTIQPQEQEPVEPQHGPQPETHREPQQQPKRDEVDHVLEQLGVSESIATSARAILDTIKGGEAPGENFIKLIVNALNHDDDVKNAEAAGYLRGRNEAIDAATGLNDDQQPAPVNFPVYRKRSFWDL